MNHRTKKTNPYSTAFPRAECFRVQGRAGGFRFRASFGTFVVQGHQRRTGPKEIQPPDWSRLEGAAELADLMEWDFVDKSVKEKTELVLPIDDKELEGPEWSQLAGFQLSLDLRRSRWLKAKKELQSEKAPWLSVSHC